MSTADTDGQSSARPGLTTAVKAANVVVAVPVCALAVRGGISSFTTVRHLAVRGSESQRGSCRSAWTPAFWRCSPGTCSPST
jgi:hypothetical protein